MSRFYILLLCTLNSLLFHDIPSLLMPVFVPVNWPPCLSMFHTWMCGFIFLGSLFAEVETYFCLLRGCASVSISHWCHRQLGPTVNSFAWGCRTGYFPCKPLGGKVRGGEDQVGSILTLGFHLHLGISQETTCFEWALWFAFFPYPVVHKTETRFPLV